jgi:hypothetical protein
MTNLAKKTIGISVIHLMIALAFTVLLTPTHRLEADISPTLDSITLSSDSLELLRTGLEIKKVSKIFKSLGYDESEIQARMGGLDAGEIRLLAGDLENSMVPSGDGTTLIVLGAVALILLVVLTLNVLKGIGRR